MEPYSKVLRDYVPVVRTRKVYNYAGTLIVNQFVENSTVTCGGSLSGFKNPAWRSQVASATGATTGLSANSVALRPGFVSTLMECRRTGNQQIVISETINGAVSPWIPGVPSAPPPSVKNQALGRFFNKARDAVSTCKSLAVLGELRQTIGLLRRPFASLVGLLRDRERRLLRYTDRHSLRTAAAGTWLELQFGVRPLISDITSYRDFLCNRVKRLGASVVPIKATSTLRFVTESESFLKVSYEAPAGMWLRYIGRTTENWSVRYKGGIFIGSAISEYSRLRALDLALTDLGLTFEEFVPTLLELTPWSFLIDYVSNFSDVINGLNFPRSRIAWVNETQRSLFDAVGFPSDRPQTGWFQSTGSPAYQYRLVASSFVPPSHHSKRVVRTKLNGYDLPGPEISFDLPNLNQLSNMVALAASQNVRRFSRLS